VIIGQRGRNISQTDALGHVAGYCIGPDMTVRGIEDRSFRKSDDTFTILGRPWLVTADEIPSPGDLQLSFEENSQPCQRSSSGTMTVGIKRMIEFASANYTLYPR
jgi:2-keto-4-pentenoate hydratase/2-oxohepta-3-ene-1,7-dioic acid hydratase in catechol pathway